MVEQARSGHNEPRFGNILHSTIADIWSQSKAMKTSRRTFIRNATFAALGSLLVAEIALRPFFDIKGARGNQGGLNPGLLQVNNDMDERQIKKQNNMEIKKVSFKNRNWNVAANLHLPHDFDKSKKYAAIVCVHPGSSVKEQTAGLYAAKLALQGFVAIVFDASFTGESGGEPRYLEDPATRVEDIRCAVDFLMTQNYVDGNRIGLLGICAGGGIAANATLTERRIKALVTISGTNARRAYSELDFMETLEAVGAQRTEEARGAQPKIVPWTPKSADDAKKQGITEPDMLGAIDYYRTPRGEYPTSNNRLLFTSMSALVAFDAFHLAERLLTQPLLVIVGDKVGAFGSYRDGFDLYNKAASKDKAIHVVKGAGHYDLYDQPEATTEAFDKLVPFFRENLL